MKIKDLQTHCEEQIKRLPKGSKMYEEHMITLAIIDTNKKYFNEIDKLNKMIDFILEEQIEEGYLVNFNNLEEAKEYYERKVKDERI